MIIIRGISKKHRRILMSHRTSQELFHYVKVNLVDATWCLISLFYYLGWAIVKSLQVRRKGHEEHE